MFARRLSDADADQERARERYERIRDEMIELLDRIDDNFYRALAAHQVISMVRAAGDDAVARALLVSVRDRQLRDRIVDEFPDMAGG